MTPSAEVGLLVWAVRGGGGAAPLDGLRWRRVLASADWHGVAPLLWQALRAADATGLVPPPAADVLSTRVRDTTARNLFLERELGRVVGTLADAGVPTALLKGAALLTGAYAHPGLRPMSDLDLLVRPEHAGLAYDAVVALGYRPSGGAVVGVDHAARLREHHHHHPLVGPGLAVVELHHRSIDRGDPAGDVALWNAALPAPKNPRCLVPCSEDLFATVAAHFVLDRRDSRPSALRQVADLRRIGDLVVDWDRVVDQARRWGIAAEVHLAARAAELVAGLVIPDEIGTLRGPTTTERAVDRFLATRVLSTGRALPVGDLASHGPRRLFSGRAALEHHVRTEETTAPSLARLRARRTLHLVRRAASELPRSRLLRTDVRVARWLADLLDAPDP